MEWKILSKLDASAITNTWQQMDKDTFNDMVADWPKQSELEMPKEYKLLRTEVIKAYENSKIKVRDNVDYRKKKEYFTDLFFALDFYEIMKKYNFSVRMASNDQVWLHRAYIMVVLPFPKRQNGCRQKKLRIFPV